MAILSHKSESTIREYAEKCPVSKRKAMYVSHANNIIPAKKTIPANSTVYSPLPPPANVTPDPQIDFNLVGLFPMDDDTNDDDALMLEVQTPKNSPQTIQNPINTVTNTINIVYQLVPLATSQCVGNYREFKVYDKILRTFS